MAKFDRSKAREALLKRTQESYERKDGDTSLKYFRADIEIPLWQARVTKEEPHIIDIIPFLAGKNFTQTDRRNPIKENDYVYWLEVYIHQNIGPAKEWIVCPLRNYGKTCPICEEIDKRSAAGQEYDDYVEIALRRRCVYNIVCYDDPKEESKGVQVWEVSFKYGEKQIQLAAKAPRGGGIVPFSDPDIGKSISFEVAGDEYRTIAGHKLIDRDYTLSDNVLEQVRELDKLIVIKSYEEIFKSFFGEEYKASEKKVDKSKTEEADVPEPEIPPTGGRQRRRMVTEEKSDNPCPANGKFGEEIDQLENCKTCKAYNGCADKAEEIEAKLKAEKEEKRGLRRRG
uniref:Bacteriophage T4 Gp32 single-stranded DNA-binding domain-containing protein n=1 Tax=viral metagenome TaxID=1070528 RepID=A0A6M3M3B2_9ZZZZ